MPDTGQWQAWPFEVKFTDYKGDLPGLPRTAGAGKIRLDPDAISVMLRVSGRLAGRHDGPSFAYAGVGVAAEARANGCRVCLWDQQGAAGWLELPQVSVDQLAAALAQRGQQLVPYQSTTPAPPVPVPAAPVATAAALVPAPSLSTPAPPTTPTRPEAPVPAELYPVTRAPGGQKATLRFDTDGIHWGQFGTDTVRIPWANVAAARFETATRRHGRQRSAFGVGPIGLAVVAGTAVSNARARRLDVYGVLTVTGRDGHTAQFVSTKPDELRQVAAPALRAFPQATQGPAAATPTPRAAPNMTDQLATLTELHRSGALSDDEFAAAKARLLG